MPHPRASPTPSPSPLADAGRDVLLPKLLGPHMETRHEVKELRHQEVHPLCTTEEGEKERERHAGRGREQ